MRRFTPLLLLVAACVQEPATPPAIGYEGVADSLTAFIEREMERKDLPAFSIALVDGQETVWASGFGEERPGVPADASTNYRVGSVSKLFTDIAVMQLHERGDLDIDVPVSTYLPEFVLDGETAADAPTLRQLMAHRGGIIREPEVGNYFADDEPTLRATVESLYGTPRIYEPETRIKYSNAGIATVGYVLEELSGIPFTEYVHQQLLAPLGMRSSSFAPNEDTRGRLAEAVMWSFDGREFPAPTFELGMAPAGSMYAPVTDLAQFMSAVFDASPSLGIADSTLQEMLTPQFGESGGFGLGFSVGTEDGVFWAGHGGAIYGFATELMMLPEEGLGVAAVTSMDVANTVTNRVADYALRLMLAARNGEPLPAASRPSDVPADLAAAAEGVFAFPDGDAVTIVDRGPRGVWGEIGRGRYLLGAFSDTLVFDDRHGFGGFLRLDGEDLLARDGTRLTRMHNWPGPRPSAPPAELLDYIGEYGWDHNVLIAFEKAGELYALIEWIEMDPLERMGDDRFAFPRGGGLYHGEEIVFERDASGSVVAAIAAGVRFERRHGADDGETFAIDPVGDVAEIRANALSATPPPEDREFLEPDLVEIRDIEPGIQYDLRYATTNNFMQSVFYRDAHAFMQRPAAEALARVHRAMAEHGYGLLIHDAYRPWFVTKMFWDATPENQKQFVANPANGSRHNRGAAVDLTLYDLETGEPVAMPSGYDEFTERAYAEYVGGTSLQRWHRELLRKAMEAEDFEVYQYEWWHFDYGDWRRYPIQNETFEEVLSEAG